MDKEMIYKSRSFLSCMNTAYKLIGDNIAKIIRKLLLPILVLAICNGIMSSVQASGLAALATGTPQTSQIIIFYAAAAVALICNVWLIARLMAMLNGMTEKQNLIKVTFTFINNILIFAVVSAVIGALLYMAYRHSNTTIQMFLTNNWIVVLGALIAICVVMLPLIYTNMRYINKKEASFWKDFHKTYATGVRHIGTLLITTLLLAIIVFVIFSIACMPLFILNTAQTTSLFGEMMGDPSDLPSSFAWLMFFTALLTSIFVSLVYVYPNVVYFLLYGSIEKQREERREMITGDKSFGEMTELPELPMVKL